MTAPKINTEISVGAIIHTLVLFAILAASYGAFSQKLDEKLKNIDRMSRQMTQIEHYLSSKDSEYWKKVAQNGDSQ